MTVPLLNVERHWYCPRCGHTDVTRQAFDGIPQRFHICAALKGVMAPMLEEGVRGDIVANVREDYVGNEQGLRYDSEGQPIMSVSTIRENGQDVAVFAPCAVARWKDAL